MNTSPGIDTASNKLQEIISAAQVESAIEQIVARWEAPREAHERFRRWASQMTEALSPESSDFTDRVAALRVEFRALHEALARTLVQFGHVDEGLVSRRSFVARILDIAEPHMPSVAVRHTFVRTAA